MSLVEAYWDKGFITDERWMTILKGRFPKPVDYEQQVKLNYQIRSLLEDPCSAVCGYRADLDEVTKAWRDYWACNDQDEVAHVVSGWLSRRIL